MRAVVQRVNSAAVTVDGEKISEIGKGYLVLLGVGEGDTERECEALSKKLAALRIFSDENDKINLSIKDVGGELLVVSQFTLYADCRKGNRPGFAAAKPPRRSRAAVRPVLRALQRRNPHRKEGDFRRGYEGIAPKRRPIYRNTGVRGREDSLTIPPIPPPFRVRCGFPAGTALRRGCTCRS